MTNIYDLPNASQSNGLLEMVGYVNTVSDGIFFPSIFLVLFFVIFFVSINITSASRSIIFASFLTGVLAMPMAVLGLIAPKIMYLLLLILAFGVLWKTIEER
jgi:hypothetical protein